MTKRVWKCSVPGGCHKYQHYPLTRQVCHGAFPRLLQTSCQGPLPQSHDSVIFQLRLELFLLLLVMHCLLVQSPSLPGSPPRPCFSLLDSLLLAVPTSLSPSLPLPHPHFSHRYIHTQTHTEKFIHSSSLYIGRRCTMQVLPFTTRDCSLFSDRILESPTLAHLDFRGHTLGSPWAKCKSFFLGLELEAGVCYPLCFEMWLLSTAISKDLLLKKNLVIFMLLGDFTLKHVTYLCGISLCTLS